MGKHLKRIAVASLAGLILLAGASGAAAVQPGDEGPAGTDTWYHDLCGHWSHHYVYTLWKEGVTNGFPFPVFLPGGGWEMGYEFRPDTSMTRGKLLYMMSKLFQLAPDEQTPSLWPDLAVTQTLYGHPAYGLLRAAALEWEVAEPGGTLNLYATGRRLDAVEFIMAALNLTGYPQQLSDDDADDILSPYVDEHHIAPGDRRLVAAAVQLGLVIGYNDDTLRMYDTLTRAEAVTILYRSCLMRVEPAYSVFYPDGDGYRDELSIEATGLRNTATVQWQVNIIDGNGQTIVHLPDAPQSGEPGKVTWDGYDDSGSPAAAGTYFVGGFAENQDGNTFEAVRVPVQLSRRHLQAEVDPETQSLGKHFHVLAQTQGGATEVTATVPEGSQVQLLPAGRAGGWSLWELQLRACEDSGLSPGGHQIEVEAQYTETERSSVIDVQVTDPANPGNGGEEPPELVPVLTR